MCACARECMHGCRRVTTGSASIDVGSSYCSLPRQRPAPAEMIVAKSKKIFVANDEGNMAMIGWESFQAVSGLICYQCKVMRACHKS